MHIAGNPEPLTDQQRELIALAAELGASKFAPRAARYDREASFPFENYDDLREAGYLGLTVPEELGGRGAGLGDLILCQERLAMGDGSTALAAVVDVLETGSAWMRSVAA